MNQPHYLTVGQAAALSGVSVRTLRYYDQIGLLKPQQVGENGYRYYTQENLQTLQQILFFRELEFPLKEIARILRQPDFDRQRALQEHRKLLLMRKKRLEQLIALTEQGWKGELQMNFKPFDEKELLQYQQEAKERWGNTGAWQQSQQKAKGRSKEDWNQVKEEADAIFQEMALLVGTDPAGKEAQRMVARWQDYITRNHYDCTREILAGLGEMYRADERFAQNLNRYADGLAEFFAQAIEIYCQNPS